MKSIYKIGLIVHIIDQLSSTMDYEIQTLEESACLNGLNQKRLDRMWDLHNKMIEIGENSEYFIIDDDKLDEIINFITKKMED